MLGASLLPSRLANVVAGWGPVSTRLERAVAGTLLDLSACIFFVVPMLAALVLLVPLVWKARRTSAWQASGAALMGLVVGFPLTVLSVIAQEMKTERGSFPTAFDLAEGGSSASFLDGALDFLSYDRIRFPAVVGLTVAAALVWVARRHRVEPVAPLRAWSVGVLVGLVGLSAVVRLAQSGLAQVNRYSPAALGDPLTGLIESTIDVVRQQGPSTPRALVLSAELSADLEPQGRALLGWPPTLDGGCEPARRPLDFDAEPASAGAEVLRALREVSAQRFTDDGGVAVFFVSLEGFRADDVHALNPQAPREIAPFMTSLYERAKSPGSGVLASTRMVQAGVRTAHNLGAMMCGLGTLPYNLAFVRDLQPFPLRCLPDVLADASFEHTFFYGSDATFDEMQHFFEAHRTLELVTQQTLPKDLPKGTWDAVTDFAVFDAAVRRVADRLTTGAPQFATVMSLSHHSPFTTPQDMPDAVKARVKSALATASHHADADDEKRLVAFSYTDAALERLVTGLEQTGLAERSIVVAMADHSTGHAYVWGKESTETDAQKAQVPFVIILPRAGPELTEPLRRASDALNARPTSLNDVPMLLLALLSQHPAVKALPSDQRWHTLGGQRTSPWFKPRPGVALLSINGVSELFALDETGARTGDYEDSVFLKTRADRYRVTPTLIPVTAALRKHLECAATAAH